MAKSWNVIPNAKLGLADICAATLHLQLDKTDTVHLRTDWSRSKSSQEQHEYAANYAYASLKIYNHLADMSLPLTVNKTTLPGTWITLFHCDGKPIAEGHLSSAPHSSTFLNISITDNQSQVTIE